VLFVQVFDGRHAFSYGDSRHVAEHDAARIGRDGTGHFPTWELGAVRIILDS
jgi:hypothetical protein